MKRVVGVVRCVDRISCSAIQIMSTINVYNHVCMEARRIKVHNLHMRAYVLMSTDVCSDRASYLHGLRSVRRRVIDTWRLNHSTILYVLWLDEWRLSFISVLEYDMSCVIRPSYIYIFVE